MRFFYLDASALGKRYVPEAGSALVNHLFASVPPGRFYVFNVGIAELVSILVRKRNLGQLPPAMFAQALLVIGTEIVGSPALNRVIADHGLVASALPLIAVHSLNGTDAIILRSALNLAALHRPAGDDLVLVASDFRLLRAARTEGLLVFDPETQGQSDLDPLL